MNVVDASVLVNFLIDHTDVGRSARLVLREEEQLAAPHLVDLEVVAALRRHHLQGLLPLADARRALERLASLPLERHPHTPLLQRCWELRDNVKTYDAVYVALAEALGVTLLTADARLAHADGLECQVQLLT